MTLIIGMLTSWNKLCFTTGYIEVSVSMPGSPDAPGLWPGMPVFLPLFLDTNFVQVFGPWVTLCALFPLNCYNV